MAVGLSLPLASRAAHLEGDMFLTQLRRTGQKFSGNHTGAAIIALFLALGAGSDRGQGEETIDWPTKHRTVHDLIGEFLLAVNLQKWDKAAELFSEDMRKENVRATSAAGIAEKWEVPTQRFKEPFTVAVKTELTSAAGEQVGQRTKGVTYLKRSRRIAKKNPSGKGWQEDVLKEFFEVEFEAIRHGDRWLFTSFRRSPSEKGPKLEEEATLQRIEQVLSRKGLPPSQRGQMLAHKANVFVQKGDYEQAEEVCKEALKLGKTVQMVHTVYAGMLKRQKRYAEAIEQYRAALEFRNDFLRPEDARKEIEACEALIPAAR